MRNVPLDSSFQPGNGDGFVAIVHDIINRMKNKHIGNMAKIIGFSKDKNYVGECHECGAITEFSGDEIRISSNDESGKPVCNATCPLCGGNVDVRIAMPAATETQPMRQYPTDKLSNCISNCKCCLAKCIYRFEPYDEKLVKPLNEEFDDALAHLIPTR